MHIYYTNHALERMVKWYITSDQIEEAIYQNVPVQSSQFKRSKFKYRYIYNNIVIVLTIKNNIIIVVTVHYTNSFISKIKKIAKNNKVSVRTALRLYKA